LTRAPDRDIAGIRSVYLVSQGSDLDQLIRSDLERRGYTVSEGGDNGVQSSSQAIVTYHEEWQNDLGHFLAALEIDLREPDTRKIIARADSSHTGWSKEDAAGVVHDTLTKIFETSSR
jgi:hypothetical protein